MSLRHEPIRKVLIANRGEVALRIIRACRELGITAVAIYSEQDRLQPHRSRADEAYLDLWVGRGLGPVAAYSDLADVIRIARESGVDAVHPGYGFLSERGDFAETLARAGVRFLGPPPSVLYQFGNKLAARKLAAAAGLPILPATEGPVDLEGAKAFCREHLPAIFKALEGGGGRGHRPVFRVQDVESAFDRSISESRAAGGKGTVFVERLILRPRHIEVQILGDRHGNVVHLYERDCSVQRRHQKIIEAAPAPFLEPKLRERILQAALSIGNHVRYESAGTVEFLVDSEQNFFFIEVNPRLQVEHTVTEEITGVDLVQSQIKIAEGATLQELDLMQDDIKPHGFAIQCRVTSEDPERNFQPDSGRIEWFQSGEGMGIRLDGGIAFTGAQVSPFYDSLLVKVIAKANTRKDAIAKILRALKEFRIRGIKNNIPFLINVLENEKFLKGEINTSFIQENSDLFNRLRVRDRARKLLSFVGYVLVNGPPTPLFNESKSSPVEPIPPVVQHVIRDGFKIIPEVPMGYRNILREKGPEVFAQTILKQNKILLCDTTFRDSHQSLLATRVRTYDMLKVSPFVSHHFSNLYSLENWGGATFDVAMRFLYECPWERLFAMRSLMPNIPFQMLLRGANAVGYTAYPDNVIFKFCELAHKAGIDIFRVFDSLNYFPNLQLGIEAAKSSGGVVEAAICYTGDVSNPDRKKYDLKYYLDLSEKVVAAGTHVLAIKDMAGLLKPKAATILVSALRDKFPDIPLHLHTHDTGGVGVATLLAAAEAGASVLDVAADSMSGLTSQPSMGAIVASLPGQTGITSEDVSIYSAYWEQVRTLYAPFESTLKSGNADVFVNEIPGGQYTNLQFQAYTLGLADRFERIKRAYAEANRALGDIVKVTPSSKAIGDLAQFMVQNSITTAEELEERVQDLSLPSSVIELLRGNMGEPHGGFPEPFLSKALKDIPRFKERPGKSLESLDFDKLQRELEEDFGKLSEYDIMSSAIYPDVANDFFKFRSRFGPVDKLPTRVFLHGPNLGEEVIVVLAKGKTLVIRWMATSENVSATGHREVFIEANGQLRSVMILDEARSKVMIIHEKAKEGVKGEIGAPMPGIITHVLTKPGNKVTAGSPLLVISAMKMELVVQASIDGTVDKIKVSEGTRVEPNDLLIVIK